MGTGWSQEEAFQSHQNAEPTQSDSQLSMEKTTETQLLCRTDSKKVVVEKPADAKVCDTKTNNVVMAAAAAPPPSPAATLGAAKLLHNYEVIMRDADSLPTTEGDKLYDQLCNNGVFLNKRRQKYWVDKKSNGNCFMLFARDLSITWADDNRFWHWPYLYETSDVYVDVAEVLNVCWLEVHKKFNTRNLTAGILYEVVLVMMLKISAYGWEIPVNFRLTLPNGTKQEHKQNFMSKPREQWIEVAVGEFRTSPENDGEIEIYIYEHEGGQWKRGLIIKGVAIRPKS